MKAQWQQWQAKFEQADPKRRRIWFAVIVLMILYLGFWVGARPALDLIQAEHNKQQQVQGQIAQLQGEINSVDARLAGDPQAAQRQRLEQLQQRLVQINQRLNQEANYVSAADNRALLKALLNEAKGVKVTSAQALPAELVYQDAENEDSAIYRHRLQLTVQGRYFALADYLQQLEQLDWSFYWQRLDYKVLNAPNAEAVIEIYTISLERDYVAS
jgi:MSHA biogenesis protein MshJ